MKHCPNCQAEIEEAFEMCWNCCYSFTEERVIETGEARPGVRNINCLRCNIPLVFSGNFKFHEGVRTGVLGNLFELFVNRESFDLYICPKCGKVEFFTPLI
ncbi:MAG: hypothetical protein Q8928_01125 [Bacteroidota bacterium]|nr:hypothetical protein [Bacteroidota bacterium]